jgi:hypothetical protein
MPRCADALPISVHYPIEDQQSSAPAASLGMVRCAGRESGGHRVPPVSRRVGTDGVVAQATHRDTRFGPRLPASSTTTVVLSACCKEGSIAVSCGTPRHSPSAGQRVSPGMVGRIPSSPPIPRAFGGLRSRMAPGLGETVVVTRVTEYPLCRTSCGRPTLRGGTCRAAVALVSPAFHGHTRYALL